MPERHREQRRRAQDPDEEQSGEGEADAAQKSSQAFKPSGLQALWLSFHPGRYRRAHAAEAPALSRIASGMPDFGRLVERVDLCVDDRGRARDDASPLLVLSGKAYVAIPFGVLHARLCDALRGNRPRLAAEVLLPGGSTRLVFEDGSVVDVAGG